jgi:hypothetical protein
VPAPDRPAALLAAAGLAAVEAVGLIGYAAVVVLHGLGGDASSPANVALLAALVLAWAAGLGVAARALLSGRRWARSPLIVNQLLLVAVGIPVAQGASGWLGWPMVAVALVALAALASPAVTRSLMS